MNAEELIDMIEAVLFDLKPHSHKCEECGCVWQHTLPPRCSSEEFRELHMCPDCHKGPFVIRL